MRLPNGFFHVAIVAGIIGAAACSAGNGSVFGEGDSTARPTGAGGSSATGGMGGGWNLTVGTGSGSTCNAGPTEDLDGDGFTIDAGDCNDCDANVNPNAVEVVVDPNAGGSGPMPPPTDENCDMSTDEPPMPCDASLLVDSSDPNDAARAVGLCKFASGPNDWGVQSAQWVSVDGTPAPPSANFSLGHGILTAFGANVNVQEGAKMLAVSSGSARQPSDPGYQDVSGFDKQYTSSHPFGFPKESPSCPGVTTGIPHDGTAVEITIKTPSNAHGFRFNFDFYTYEWPGWVCSTYNDFFVAILDPIPMGQTDGNISFDQLNNPVSVNNAFLEVCGCTNGPPCMAGGKTFSCALGATELLATGFGYDTAFQDHGATSWLQTQAPVDPNVVIKIRWGTYDSGDGVLDSTTLVDNFEWLADPGTTVGTEPVPDPK